MGRAIDMEKDIDALKLEVEKLKNTVRGMVSKLDSLNEKLSKTKHIDLVEETKTGEGNAKKEKTNNEGNGKRSVKSDKRSSDDKKSSDESWVFSW